MMRCNNRLEKEYLKMVYGVYKYLPTLDFNYSLLGCTIEEFRTYLESDGISYNGRRVILGMKVPLKEDSSVEMLKKTLHYTNFKLIIN